MSKTKDKILFTGNNDFSPTSSTNYNNLVKTVGDKAVEVAQNAKNKVQYSVRNTGDKLGIKSLIKGTTPAPTSPTNSIPNTATEGMTDKSLTYTDMYKQLQDERQQETEKMAKKARRDMILAKLSDGISAIANLVATTKGAQNSYTGDSTRTENTRKRWEDYYNRYIQEQKERYKDMEDAMRLDEAIRYRNEDKEKEDTRYKENIEHRNERELIADERYKKEQEYRKDRDEEADRRWQQTFEENKRMHNANIEIRKEEAKARTARGVRGKQLGFADGKGNQVSIYENVWKGSMQQVYDVLYEDMVKAYNENKNNNPRVPKHKTQKEKDDFVKQNWHKSPRASQIMLTLSTIDPATMTSEINDDSNQSLGWGNPSNNTTDW